ncbi:GNAT family N-acetyltransferase [Pseudomonas fluorescens]|jgi:GNAT superfamily N-acetyltransferase|uniref:GNAT family N-acetyltransferase n=1 Tax=Pseudomonas fluorescens TaxID=294 RepID=UPI00054C43FA|nr:GNAT family N-acetyltransferase [Pseudomonas fluorescens]KII29568.1 GCN5 family acetyltransferase [Pseudomonas fluorescens]
MDNVTLRSYRRSDAAAISRLFREIYGDHYVQPHVYLPLMINQNHCDGTWHSLVAESGQKILGHATLCRNAGSHTAELALSVVHPSTRGQNIATQLGTRLLIHAQALGCHGVTIKQVTQHAYTQRMAHRLGFCSSGLLLDYVPSPFGETLPESIVIGYTPIDGYRRPLPALLWPQSCREFMEHLCEVYGTQEKEAPWVGPPLHVEQCAGRYDVMLKKIDSGLLKQLRRLPQHWMISIRLRLATGFASAVVSLSALGFIFTGIAPNDRGAGWLALFHRGYRSRSLELHCPHIQRLHDQAQLPIAVHAEASPLP